MLAARDNPLSIPSTTQHYNGVVDNIRRATMQVNRDPEEIKILAVSKQKSVSSIRKLVALGVHNFGENYVAEALPKIKALSAARCTWHFVGVVQSNKTKDIARHFDWVHSVDQLRIGTRLAIARRQCAAQPLNVCVQVNIDAEPTKAGVSVAEVSQLVQHLLPLPELRVRGLMVIPKPTANQEETRHSFRRANELFEQLRPLATDRWDTLSMGMSADFEIAIEEGATMVRIGTALFGPRT